MVKSIIFIKRCCYRNSVGPFIALSILAGLVDLHHHPVCHSHGLDRAERHGLYVQQWDPYPFILLNLALSFQAAYAAPFIMMSQNRQQDIDRKSAEHDYQINIKAELEIELLHQKIDALRETELLQLTAAVKDLSALLARKEDPGVNR